MWALRSFAFLSNAGLNYVNLIPGIKAIKIREIEKIREVELEV